MGYVIAPVSAFPDGARRIVEVGGRSIGVFRVGDEFFALRNRCPHQGAPLCEGKLMPRLRGISPGDYAPVAAPPLLSCPWHGWEYDLGSGQSWMEPDSSRVRCYPVDRRSGRELAEEGSDGRARGPYVAETFQVTVEDDYVVLAI